MSLRWIYIVNIALAALVTHTLMNQLHLWDWTGVRMIGVFLALCIVLWLLSFIYSPRAFRQVPRILNLTVYFLKELVVANIRVTYEVLTPTSYLQPAVITVPLDLQQEKEIMLLANMITLTPGTLTIDVTDDQQHLIVHTLYSGKQQDDFKRNIKDGFEKKILNLRKF